MPELPEVEFARQCLERWLGARKLVRIEAEKSRILRGSSPAKLEALAGHKVAGVDRRGKWLTIRLDRGMAIGGHLGMTGKLELWRKGDRPVKWSRARFHRSDGAVVHFQDPRMFGRLFPGTLDEVQADGGYRALGPDAWDEPPTGERLQERLGARRRPIKDALMDQSILAGIGNIQATEALFHARIHPARAASTLDSDDYARIVKGIRWSLKRTLAMNKGDKIVYVEESNSEENPFLVYGRAGEDCPECGHVLDKLEIGGRTSTFCPRCQRLKPGRRTSI